MPFSRGLIAEAAVMDIYEAHYQAKFDRFLDSSEQRMQSNYMGSRPKLHEAIVIDLATMDPLSKGGLVGKLYSTSPSPYLRQIFTWALWFLGREEQNGMLYNVFSAFTKLRGRYHVKQLLTEFDEIQKFLPPELRAINRFKTLPELEEFLYAEGPKYREQAVQDRLRKESRILYEDDHWKLVRPKTYFASVYYGKGSDWCTANEDSSNYFNQYSKNGTLVMCLSKNEPEESVQVFVPEGESAFPIEIRYWDDTQVSPLYARDNDLSRKVWDFLDDYFGIDLAGEYAAPRE